MGRKSHMSRLPERDREWIERLRDDGNSFSTVARTAKACGISEISRSSIYRYARNLSRKEQPRPASAKVQAPSGPIEYCASRRWDELVALFRGNVAEAIRASRLKK